MRVGYQVIVGPLSFNGTPYQFALAVHRYFSLWGQDTDDPRVEGVPVVLSDPYIAKDAKDASASITDQRVSDGVVLDAFAHIKVYEMPNGTTLTVEASELDWVVVEPSWLVFRKFLEEQSLIGKQPPANQVAAIQATNKRTRQRYSDQEQQEAVMAWETFDKGTNPLTLEEWLDKRFGNEDGTLNVPPSTFYGWRTKWLKKP